MAKRIRKQLTFSESEFNVILEAYQMETGVKDEPGNDYIKTLALKQAKLIKTGK